MLSPEFDNYAVKLIEGQEWALVLQYLRSGVQQISCREDGQRLGMLAKRVPVKAWASAQAYWELGLIGYRAGDEQLMRMALEIGGTGHADLQGIRAYLCLLGGQHDEALACALKAKQNDVIALRTTPRIIWALGEKWPSAYEEALKQTLGRDRALIGLEFAIALSLAQDDCAARSAYARAVTDFKNDVWGRVSALGNLGMACLNLGDLKAAERAFVEGIRSSGRGGAEVHLCLLWRGMGGLWRAYGEYPRALSAFQKASKLTVNPREELPPTIRAEALIWAVTGDIDKALALVVSGLIDLHIEETTPHKLHIDLAMFRLLMGDLEGCEQALKFVQVSSHDDEVILNVTLAERFRRKGQTKQAIETVQKVLPKNHQLKEFVLLFPDLFALVNVQASAPIWEVQVSVDGLTEVRSHGEPLELRALGDGATLLVFLLKNRGQVSRERVVDAFYENFSIVKRTRALNSAVRQIRMAFHWQGVINTDGQVLQLSSAIRWLPLILPAPEQADTLCEGRYDQWILDWRSEREALKSSYSY